jgi:putative transposase
MKWSTSQHRPPHLYMDNAWYFVTASTLDKAHILVTDEHLNLWVNTFNELVLQFQIKLIAWVVLSNHYHLLFMPNKADELGGFLKRLNGSTSRKLNLLDNKQGRTVWYSYWDRCMRNEHDFWTRFNYINYNPVKHGYVINPEDWGFSSYRFYVRNDENKWLSEKLNNFPITDLFDDDKF